MISNRDMYHASAVVREDNEYEQQPVHDGRDDEEISGVTCPIWFARNVRHGCDGGAGRRRMLMRKTDQDGTIRITVDAASNSYTVDYGMTSRTFPVKAPVAPPSVPPSVSISSLVPNRVGDDEQLKTVTLRNSGTTPVSLVGWTLKDRRGATWNLAGSLAAGESRTFRRDGQP